MTAVISPAEKSFSNNFWGLKDDGYYALTAKFSSTKKTFEEIKSFYSLRASLHEDVGRKLLKQAKAGIGMEEIGTLHDLLTSANKESERAAESHLGISQKIKSKLEVELDIFILEYKEKRKLTQSSVEKAHKSKQNSEAYLAKVKEKYEADCAKLVAMQTQIGSLSGRDAGRAKQKIERLQQEVKIQEQDYRDACDRVANATVAWNRMWKLACDTYQVLEKKRLEFLQHSLASYVDLLTSVTNEEQQSHKRLQKALEGYQPAKDIQTFIEEAGTGPQIPEPEIFVDYFDDPQKTLQRHSIANFEVPAELTMKKEDSFSNDKPLPTAKESEIDTVPENKAADLKILPEDAHPANKSSDRSQTVAEDVPHNIVECETPTDRTTVATKERVSTSERKMSLMRKANKPLPPITMTSTPALSSSASLLERQRQKLPPLLEKEGDDGNIKEMEQPVKEEEIRNPACNDEYNKETESSSEQSAAPSSPPTPPVLIVPDISLPSSNDTSDEENDNEKSNKGDEGEEGNMAIDPRAKVVFAIGNNMFDLGHLNLENDPNAIPGTVRANRTDKGRGRARRSSVSTRRRPPSVDIEAACNFSYQSLLEELGVLEKKESSENSKDQRDGKCGSTTTTEEINPQQPSRNNSQKSSRSETSRTEGNTKVVKDNATNDKDESLLASQRDTHANSSQTNHNMTAQPTSNVHQNAAYTNAPPALQPQYPYSSTYQVQQHAHQPQQTAFYHSRQQSPYGTLPHNPTCIPQAAPMYPHSTTGYVGNVYSQQQPQSVLPTTAQMPNQHQHPPAPYQQQQQQQQPSILFWGMTLTDWRSDKPEELQFVRGTWLGILDVRPGNWYYAVKLDPRTNTFTNEKGFVAQHMVQQVHTTTF